MKIATRIPILKIQKGGRKKKKKTLTLSYALISSKKAVPINKNQILSSKYPLFRLSFFSKMMPGGG